MNEMRSKIAEDIKKLIIISLILFGMFIAYQLIKPILGGSWSAEDIILSLLVFNTGAVFTICIMLATLVSDNKHLSDSFSSLARDFKEHLKKSG